MSEAKGYPKRLIEIDLPIKRISVHARREKSIRHGHISTLHIWWARRPLAACRAVLCAALWPDPADPACPTSFKDEARKSMLAWAVDHAGKSSAESFVRLAAIQKYPAKLDDDFELRKTLLDFIADFADWSNSSLREYLDTSRALTEAAHNALTGPRGSRPLIIDPFAGGASIPLEALRIGADAFASDLNPLAVLLNKVVLEYVPRYGQRLADEVRKWGNWIRCEAEKELTEFYPLDPDGATPIAYLWARTVQCEGPGCGAEVPLMRSLWLAKKKNRSVALQLLPAPNSKSVEFRIIVKQRAGWKDQANAGATVERPKVEGTVKRGSATCPCCGYTTPVERVRAQLNKKHGGSRVARLFCVVSAGAEDDVRNYRLPTAKDHQAIMRANLELKKLQGKDDSGLSVDPDESTLSYDSFSNRGPIYGMTRWGDYFTARQVLALSTLIALTKRAPVEVSTGTDESLATAVRTVLGLACSRLTDIFNALCRWESSKTQVRNLFSRQAIPMMWDFAETSLFSRAAGDFSTTLGTMIKVLEELVSIEVIGHSAQASACEHPLADDSAAAMITDPPYYYSVQYADLSDFFYVWLRRSVGHLHPDLFSPAETPKLDEIIVQSPGHQFAEEGKNNAHYESRMQLALAEGRRVVAPDGLGVVVFAHTSTAGWESQIQALIQAGWVITGSWPIDTELANRLLSQGRAVLASSVHLICRPREKPDGSVSTDEIGDWRAVLEEVPRRIHEWMPRLVDEGVVGADAIFACLGPALEIFSRHSRVEKVSGAQVSLREYLEQVWAVVAQEAFNLIFVDSDASGLEADARLTAIWFWALRTATSTNEDRTENESTTDEVINELEEDEKSVQERSKARGYTMEYDTARKLAQGLGVNLVSLATPGGILEIKGSTATLYSISARELSLVGRQLNLFAEYPMPRKYRQQRQQLAKLKDAGSRQSILFAEPVTSAADDPQLWLRGLGPAKEYSSLLERLLDSGKTTLDRLHQSMLLFGKGHVALLGPFLRAGNIAEDPRFWKLAQSLSALYPVGSDEKRWVDGVLARKKGMGFG